MPGRPSLALARARAHALACLLVASLVVSLVVSLGACAACGTTIPHPVITLRPDETVIARFDPTRTIAFERRSGDTVRVERVSSVVGHLRRQRGDTSWIAATLVRRIDEDRPVPLSRWNTTIVSEGSTQVVALSRDTHTDRASWVLFGQLATMAAASAGTVVFLYLYFGPKG